MKTVLFIPGQASAVDEACAYVVVTTVVAPVIVVRLADVVVVALADTTGAPLADDVTELATVATVV